MSSIATERREAVAVGNWPDRPRDDRDVHRVVLFANTDWYLFNFRLSLALELKRRGADVLLVSPRGPYCDRFAGLGLGWKPLEFERRSLDPIAQVTAIARLIRLYAEEKPDVVHHFTIKSAVYGSVAAKLTGVPVIVNALAGLGSAAGKTPSAGQTLARLLAFGSLRLALRGTHVIVQNPDDQAFLVRRGLVHASACELIRGSGVDLTRFQPTAKTGAAVSVLLASRLLWSKGLAEFVEAARLVRSRHPEVRFVVAGDPDPGNPDTLLAADLARLSADPNVDFLGHVNDMPALLAETDIVALPTSYGEGVPRILVEAAAAGLPLVATDVPGCREIVSPGLNGELIAPKNAGVLAAAIEGLITAGDRRAAMGMASRLIAERDFGEAAVLSATINAYRCPGKSLPALAPRLTRRAKERSDWRAARPS